MALRLGAQLVRAPRALPPLVHGETLGRVPPLPEGGGGSKVRANLG